MQESSMISIITSGHCLCNYYNFEPTASVYCKENRKIEDHSNPTGFKYIYSNQQLGTYDPDSNDGKANTISATWGVKDLKDIKVKDKRFARDAYVMSVMNEDGKITLSGDDAYNLGIARFEVSTLEISKSKLIHLQLPPP